MTTFKANVIQFLRPHGTKKHITTDLPIDVQPLYNDMLAHECRLEAEVLLTEEVSITVANTVTATDLDFSVTPNGPAVQNGIADMLKRQCWLKPKTETESS